ncbi:neurotrophin 1-like [Daphnia carinata]|uniref:neurotrophin 1-like n=1 Tax=Daphnia carinata TaxID=120202 RepID=UPI00257C9C56|nr:neurotrophin 1-like [Daphnia carinata]
MFIKLMMFASFMAGGFCSPNSIPLPYGSPPKNKYSEIPHCAKNTTKAWCLEDSQYPQHEVQQALDQHYQAVLTFYKDKLASTENSVNGLDKFNDEVYLCPSSTDYVRPLRAINVEGKWRIIINRVESYGAKYTQTARIEECNVVVGNSCPLIPACYESKCIQKNMFHRFLVYNPQDYTFPFAIEKFKLPGSCGCVVGAFHL